MTVISSYLDAQERLNAARQAQFTDAQLANRFVGEVLGWAQARRAVDLQAHALLIRAQVAIWSETGREALRSAMQSRTLFEATNDDEGAVEATAMTAMCLRSMHAYGTCLALIDATLRDRQCSPMARANLQRHRVGALGYLGELDLAKECAYRDMLPVLRSSPVPARRAYALVVAAVVELQLENHASGISSVALLNPTPRCTGAPGSHRLAAEGLLLEARALAADAVSRVPIESMLAGCAALRGEFDEAIRDSLAAVSEGRKLGSTLLVNVLFNHALILRKAGRLVEAKAQLKEYVTLQRTLHHGEDAYAIFEFAQIAELEGEMASANSLWREFMRARLAWSQSSVQWFEEVVPPSGHAAAGERSGRAALLVRMFSDLIASQGYHRRDVAWYAKQLGVSRSTLEAAVAAERDTTPLVLIKKRRLELAARMLASTTVAAADVAECLGYSSASAFSADFRAEYGRSPSSYRTAAAVAG